MCNDRNTSKRNTRQWLMKALANPEVTVTLALKDNEDAFALPQPTGLDDGEQSAYDHAVKVTDRMFKHWGFDGTPYIENLKMATLCLGDKTRYFMTFGFCNDVGLRMIIDATTETPLVLGDFLDADDEVDPDAQGNEVGGPFPIVKDAPAAVTTIHTFWMQVA